ncbi:hypothetical protein GF327_06895 [Candidatus Woesearchaeota archaeon]|nr:hypothetical protein [Candidatus Woesearchaeota archaeon]
MRRFCLNKKAMEEKVAVVLIFSLLVLVALLFFWKTVSNWIILILDKLFGW